MKRTWGSLRPGQRRIAVALLIFGALLVFHTWRAYPPLPRTLQFQVEFAPRAADSNEPLITAGRTRAADFLTVNFPTEDTVVFTYDFWGEGGPSSAPQSFVPGRRYPLEVEMPAFSETGPVPSAAQAPLRVIFDGRRILDEPVRFNHRKPAELYFAQNPLGGTSASTLFRGRLLTADGRELTGRPSAYHPWSHRFVYAVRETPGQVLLFLVAGIAAAFLLPAVIHWGRTSAPTTSVSTRRSHLWAAATIALCSLAFTWIITGGTWAVWVEENFGTFYDFQAASLLRGRLDVPHAALFSEAFVHEGKIYGYFGPTPALLRLPFAAVGVGFGLLSRASMIVGYALALWGAYAILRHAGALTGRGEPSALATVILLLSIGLGSTLFFLGSRGYIYHEAILWGVATTVWSTAWTLDYLHRGGRAWIAALLLGTLAVHARPPLGLFALGLLGLVALVRATFFSGGANPTQRLRTAGIGLLAAAGVLSFNGLSYLKFRTIEGCPLRYNLSYNEARLARIDSRQFHWSNVPFGLDAYLLKPTLGVNPRFPFFYMDGLHPLNYPAAKIDLAEPMAGLPYAMTSLFVLAGLAVVAAFIRRGIFAGTTAMILIAAVPMAVAMFAAIAVSHRYTADFLGCFIPLAAFGLTALDQGRERWHRLALWCALAITFYGAVVTTTLSLQYQAEGVWGVTEQAKENYRRIQARVNSWVDAVQRR